MSKAKKTYKLTLYNKLFQQLICLCFKTFVRTKYKTQLEGIENIPKDGSSYIIVANHLSYDDIPVLTSVFNPPCTFVAKKELYNNPFMSFWIKSCGAIAVNREKPEKSTIKAIKEALGLNDIKLFVFIEGTRSKIEGQLGAPNNGPVYFSKLSNKPIIPVGIKYKPNNDLVIKIGEAYQVSRDQDLDDASWKCLEIISKLSGSQLPPR